MRRNAVAITIFCALLILSVSPVFGQDAAQRIDEYMTRWFEVGRFHGAVLVAQGPELIYAKGFGFANLEWNIPNSVETKFDIGSISKQFTTALVFLLAAEGKIDLDAKLTDYLPDYRADTGGRVTIDHLLQHTSGIPCFLRDFEPEPGGPLLFPLELFFRMDDLIAEHMSGDLLFEPGSEYRYSNSGFCLLAKVVEQVTGKSFEANLRERILDPLGLSSTGLISPDKIIPSMAEGYVDSPTGLMRARFEFSPNIWGAGGMYSTVGDLWKWNLAVFSGDLLPREYSDKMLSIYMEDAHGRHAYSLNYYRMRTPGSEEPVEFTTFNGAIFGFISDVFRFPDSGHIIVILDNSERFNHWTIGPAIYRLLLGEPQPMPKPLASGAVAEAEFTRGREVALELYRDIQQNHAEEYEINATESGLNSLGYNLLYVNRFDDAVRVLELNAELHPASANAHDSLGEAYMQRGEVERAQECFAEAKRISGTEDKLLELTEAGDYASAEEMIAEARKQNPEAALFTPARIGPVFGNLLNAGKLEDALAVCRLWALGNPSTPGPYFSMARVHLQSGDKAKAIECYRKVLEVAPGDRSAEAARKAIERLEQEK